MDILALTTKFQTIFVGFIGFLGVIITLWYNGRLARAQRESERSHTRKTLRRVLIEELIINRDSLEGNITVLREDPPEDGGGSYVPTHPMDEVYQSIVSRVGLLTPTEASSVISAYLHLRQYRANLFLIGVRDERTPDHVKIPAKNTKLLLAAQESLMGPINNAIQSLRQSVHEN